MALQRILVPTDLSDFAGNALRWADMLRRRLGAQLTLVYANAGEFAAWIEPHLRNRCRYTHLLASGNAAEQTIRMAHDTHANLIVLGAQHQRFADATVLGTTTERVVRFAKRAVWVAVAPAS